MTVHTITFVPPGPLFNMNTPPTSVRARIARHHDKVAWRDGVCYAALAHFRGRRITLPLKRSRVQITLPVPDNRSRDPHNYEGSCKPAVDGLVLAKVWPGDDPRWVEMAPVRLAKGRFVTIEITELEDHP